MFGNNFFMRQSLKFSLFCLIVVSIVIVPISSPIFKTKYNEEITYFFYAKTVNKQVANAKYISSGNSYIICCDFNDATFVKKHIDDVIGESVRIKNCSLNSINKILFDYKNYIIDKQQLDDYTIFLCYDDKLSNFIFIDGQKVNIQIAVKNAEINIGYPLILNGF